MDFELDIIADHLVRLLIAFALAFPVGWERGSGRSSLGFRTLPVVAMASCGFALLARSLPGADAESMTRLLQGLMGGIGFIGGGPFFNTEAPSRAWLPPPASGTWARSAWRSPMGG